MITQDTQAKLKSLLMMQEGYRATPYKDQYGNLTVGIGWNLYAMPITTDQALYLCGEHIRYFDEQLFKNVSCYESLDEVRKAVLVDMAFQLGIPHLLQFKKMIAALELHDYKMAGAAMLDSDWAKNFATRAHVLYNMIITSVWPEAK